jgi:hypothetical protein
MMAACAKAGHHQGKTGIADHQSGVDRGRPVKGSPEMGKLLVFHVIFSVRLRPTVVVLFLKYGLYNSILITESIG